MSRVLDTVFMTDSGVSTYYWLVYILHIIAGVLALIFVVVGVTQ